MMYPTDPLNELANRTDMMVEEMKLLIAELQELAEDMKDMNEEFERGMELL